MNLDHYYFLIINELLIILNNQYNSLWNIFNLDKYLFD